MRNSLCFVDKVLTAIFTLICHEMWHHDTMKKKGRINLGLLVNIIQVNINQCYLYGTVELGAAGNATTLSLSPGLYKSLPFP